MRPLLSMLCSLGIDDGRSTMCWARWRRRDRRLWEITLFCVGCSTIAYNFRHYITRILVSTYDCNDKHVLDMKWSLSLPKVELQTLFVLSVIKYLLRWRKNLSFLSAVGLYHRKLHQIALQQGWRQSAVMCLMRVAFLFSLCFGHIERE